MKAYKDVYKNEGGTLVQNTENKIDYIDEKGQKRTITNPSYKDFERVLMLPKRYINDPPEFDEQTEEIYEEISLGDWQGRAYWEIVYKVRPKEVI